MIHGKKGFTLIELLIVIIIIGILASVAFASYYKATERAMDEEANTALRMIYAAEKIYYMKHGEYCPEFSGPGSEDQINNALNLKLKLGNWMYETAAPGGSGVPMGLAIRNAPSNQRMLIIDDEGVIACQTGPCF